MIRTVRWHPFFTFSAESNWNLQYVYSKYSLGNSRIDEHCYFLSPGRVQRCEHCGLLPPGAQVQVLQPAIFQANVLQDLPGTLSGAPRSSQPPSLAFLCALTVSLKNLPLSLANRSPHTTAIRKVWDLTGTAVGPTPGPVTDHGATIQPEQTPLRPELSYTFHWREGLLKAGVTAAGGLSSF